MARRQGRAEVIDYRATRTVNFAQAAMADKTAQVAGTCAAGGDMRIDRGMAETAVRESKDRVRGAIISTGFKFPQRRISVSLGPADLRKTGGRFDLGVALGILIASRQVADGELDSIEFYGELGMNGDVRSVPGILPAALKADASGRTVIVPQANRNEAALSAARVFAVGTLLEVEDHKKNEKVIIALE